MKLARSLDSLVGVWAVLITVGVVLAPGRGVAEETGHVVFQKPQRGAAPAAGGDAVQFRQRRSTGEPTATASRSASAPDSSNPLRDTAPRRVVVVAPAAAPTATAQRAAFEQPARPLASAPRPAAVRRSVQTAARPAFAEPGEDMSGAAAARRARSIREASVEPWMDDQPTESGVEQAGFCDCGEPTCGICEPGCGIVEPECGILEPGCGLIEPGCGLMEPGCGLEEPACGCAEPSCGIVGCGSCVGNPGPDYWCFPVCLPRFKDLRFWAGVHGFKGPRDSDAFGGAGDGNFGFQEGVNIGGRPPLVSFLFPQLAYQLGYQAVQSRLSGLSDATVDGFNDNRSQHFVTAGLFRRVPAGMQFGVVWDMLRDDLITEEDFHQLRYEISLKSRVGREIGFWGASHLNNKTIDGIDYQSVDQYCGFVRLHFRDGGAIRFWGGATNDSEGLFGGDFVAPLNNRWSLTTGFNYLIPDAPDGPEGAREESWNIGINLVWHYGLTAKQGRNNPFAPLFPTADNGWMFIDARP